MRLVLFAAVILAAACGGAESTEPTNPTEPVIGIDPRLDSIFITPGRWADVGKSCTDAAAAGAVAAAGYPRPTAFLRGRWDFGQLFDWAGVIWQNFPPTPGLSSFDINEGTNRLEFGASDSTGLAALEKHFASMDLPCRLVWIRILQISAA